MVTVRSIARAIAGVSPLVHSSIAHSLQRNPISHVSLLDDPIIKAPSHRVNAHSHFEITFTLHDGQTPVRLTLEPNHDILPDDFSVTYMGHDGQVREVEPVPRHTQKLFKGRAFVKRAGRDTWSQAGWARITVRRDGMNPIFEGAFVVFGDAHHIQTATHYRKLKHKDDPPVSPPASDSDNEFMVVTRDSDIIRDSHMADELKRAVADKAACGSDTLDFNNRYDLEMRSVPDRSLYSTKIRSLFGRQSIDGDPSGDKGANYINDIGSTAGCPGTRQVALVGIATDCTYYEDFDEDRQEIRDNVVDMVQKASALYEDTFNIAIGIANLTLIDQSCRNGDSQTTPWNLPCSRDTDLNDRLNLFSEWRGRSDDSNAFWTLLTTCNTDSAVGLAWRGMLCREGASEARDRGGRNETVAAANVVVRTSAEWQIFAHETGHTFGAVHDCIDQDCPVSDTSQPCCPRSSSRCDAGGEFIMNPSTGQGISEFSPCSIGNICSGLRRNVDGECLTNNRGIGTINGSQCGNGIVEEDEDCDCGGSDDCEDSDCCNSETCKFRDGAECDPTNEDCCTDSCKFSDKGTVCRESTGDCDPEEKCSGDSGSCPRNENLDDGDSCGDGLNCASGQCTSRDEQCRVEYDTDDDNVQACGGGDTCILTCRPPGSSEGTCEQRVNNFLDGTSCSGGGRCDNGVCRGSSVWGRIQDWFRDNKNIAIPVGCVIGGLLVLAISCCIFSSCRRRRRVKRAPKPPEMSGGNDSPVYAAGGAAGGSSAGIHHHGHGFQQPHWQQQPEYSQTGYDNHREYNGRFAGGFNGDDGSQHIPPPPPAYSYGQTQDEPRQWRRTNSMRYA